MVVKYFTFRDMDKQDRGIDKCMNSFTLATCLSGTFKSKHDNRENVLNSFNCLKTWREILRDAVTRRVDEERIVVDTDLLVKRGLD